MIQEKLMRIQTEIKAPKNLYNSFGKYKYRNAEGICEAVKPFLLRENCSLTIADEIVEVGGRVYVKATVTLIDNEKNNEIAVSAFARESADKKGMDESQITGTASSYARKYALNGLFLLDDTKDADSDEYHNQTEQEKEQAAFEKETEKLANEKVPAAMAATLEKKCDGNEAVKNTIFKLYKVSSFADLNNKQARNIIDHWKDIEEKAKA